MNCTCIVAAMGKFVEDGNLLTDGTETSEASKHNKSVRLGWQDMEDILGRLVERNVNLLYSKTISECEMLVRIRVLGKGQTVSFVKSTLLWSQSGGGASGRQSNEVKFGNASCGNRDERTLG